MSNTMDTQSDPVAVFMTTPLVQWIQFLLNRDTLELEDLLDGVALNQIMLQIDPRPTNMKTHKNARQDVNLNIQNLKILINHIKSYYEEMRKQVIVMSLPKILLMIRNIRSKEGLAEMQKLLLLVLGCAVQCEHREQFILKMKQLTYDGMETMMNHIKYITENTDNVLNMQWEELTDIPPDEMEDLTRKMSDHIHRLVATRDEYALLNADVTLERDYFQSQVGGANQGRRESFSTSASRQHLMVELNDVKSKWRKTKQELDEKVEQNTDLKQECEDAEALLQDIRKENAELITDARSARALRDENDILKDKAVKASRLEYELETLKEKLKDVDFYKQRIEEVREDNRVLHDTKDLLEDQLETTRTRLDGLVDAEKKILDLKRQLHNSNEERERDAQQIQELVEKNSNLEFDKMESMNESGNLAYQLEQARGIVGGGRKTMQAEMEESANIKALRLDKENKRLQALINTYQDSVKTSELAQANMVELEKENQRLSSKVQQLQKHITKEKQSVLDFEQLSNELAAERQKLETTLETSRSTSERRIQEVEEENEQLTKTIDTLRERAKIGGDAKVKAVEKENKVLSELVKDITSKLHKSEYDRKKLNQNFTDVKRQIEQAEVVQKENTKLEKQNVTLEKTVKQLQITCNGVEELEHKSSDLEIENRQLKKQVESLKQLTDQLQVIEQDKNTTEQEVTKLRRQVDSLKKKCSRMTEVEQEKLDSDRRATRFEQSLATMKASAKHVEKMEIVQAELENELERVRTQLEMSKKRLNKREDEICELEKENDKVSSSMNQLLITTKKLERFDTENQELESDNSKLELNNKKLNNEVQRLKRMLESKTAQCDEASDELSVVNRQNKLFALEIEDLKKSTSQSSHTEEGYQKLQRQQAVDKRTLSTLREELVNEKLTSQQSKSELERLNTELENIGITREDLIKLAQDGDNDKRFKALETRLESTMQKSLGAKEEKINSLESRLQESVSLNNKLRVDIKNLKRDYDTLSQRHQEEFANEHQQLPLKRGTSSEIFKIKDHLISVERKNATLLADNSALKSSSHDLQSHVKSLQSQVSNLQSQNEKIQGNNESLQTQCAKLQVENSTLQSQCTSLMSQSARTSSLQFSIEQEKVDLLRKISEGEQERTQLEKDHDDMTVLYERQTIELESLMQDHQKLKQEHKLMKQENKSLEGKYGDVLKRSNQANKQRRSETTYASENFEALKDAHEKLNKSYKNLSNEYEDLQEEHIALKTSNNQIKLEFAKLEAETSDIKDHNQQLDIATTKLNSRCEVLLQLKANLEEENRHLLQQISRLMSQNEELLSQTLESKDQIYSEQKQYTERMQEIRRQKEKLEEKIMDIYRTPGPSPSRKKGIGATIKKTFQNLGKTSENKRRRDVPPSQLSASNLGNQGDMVSTSLKKLDAPSDDNTSSISKRDSGSIDSGSAGVTRQNSTDSKENNRRNKLGGVMAYSTNALNTLSVQSPSSDARTSPRVGGTKGVHQQPSGSLSRLRRGPGSTGDVSYRDDRTSSEDSAVKEASPTKEKISLHQFLNESKKDEQNHAPRGEKKAEVAAKPIPAKRSLSPGKRQPMRATSWATASYRRKKPSWPEADKGEEQPSSIRRCSPTLDLSSLEDLKPASDAETSGRSPRKSPKSPSALAVIKVTEKDSSDLPSDQDLQDLKRDTFVYVVRSKSDAADRANKPSIQPQVLSGMQREADVKMRKRDAPQPRPSSMHITSINSTISAGPSSNPYSTLRPNSASHLTAVQRLDSLVGSPRAGGVKEGGNKLSPRSQNGGDEVTLRSRPSSGMSAQRRPASALSTPYSSYASPNSRHGSRLPSDSSREMTSPSRVETISSNPLNVIRRDVPPSASAPIRRDVPPDPSSYAPVRRPRNVTGGQERLAPTSNGGSASLQHRPPTPRRDSAEEAEKNSQWYEYGCI